MTPLQVKRLIAGYPAYYFTEWYSGRTPPQREGLYLVRWGTAIKQEFYLFVGGKWQIIVTNPNIVLYLQPELAQSLEWCGMTELGSQSIPPIEI